MHPTLLALSLTLAPHPQAPFDADDLRVAARVVGFDWSDEKLELMLPGAIENLRHYEAMQRLTLDNAEPPASRFSPLTTEVSRPTWTLEPEPIALPDVERPDDLEDLCYADIPTLASLVRSRRVSCLELTETFLARLERLDGTLRCVVHLTPDRARAQAEALDAELEEGRWRGLLHGIPWGAKDLLAVAGTPTTWGAKPYEDQVLELDAAVVQRLDDAGAVLIAKLTLGALAWGDVWFAGRTRNPWDPDQGSSGSSAGPASATAAGGVVFSIGSETLGSIVSPSTRCGCSSLRPTFGRVSRHGAMTLSWSMDKLGPMCRSVGDAAIVFAAIQGPDPARPPRDDSLVDAPFAIPGPVPVEGFRVGYVREWQSPEQSPLKELAALGVELVPVDLPEYPVDAMRLVLSAEAACAFDELTRDGRDDRLVRQVEQAWPNVFRQARLIPAVEYLRADRLRRRLGRELSQALAGLDALVHPSFAGGILTTTNLTGHPTVVVPSGFDDEGRPARSLSFTGRLYGETRLLAVAQAWQRATGYHERHPDL